MKPVLARLRRVHLLEVDPGSDPFGVDDGTRAVPFFLAHSPGLKEGSPRRVAGRRILFPVMECRRPELLEPARMGAVEHDLDGCRNLTSPLSRCRSPPRPKYCSRLPAGPEALLARP